MRSNEVRDMYDFSCEHCGGMVRERRVDREALRHKGSFVILENVPVGVCDKCGARYFDASILCRVAEIGRARPRRSGSRKSPSTGTPPLDGPAIIIHGHVHRQDRSRDGRSQRPEHRLGHQRGALRRGGRIGLHPSAQPVERAAGQRACRPPSAEDRAPLRRAERRRHCPRVRPGPGGLRPARFPGPLDCLCPAAGASSALRGDDPRVGTWRWTSASTAWWPPAGQPRRL